MTVILITVASILALILIVVLVMYMTQNQGVKELKEKMEFALKHDNPMKIEMNRGKASSAIADFFNALVRRYTELVQKVKSLESEKSKMKKMDSKLKDFEQSISQITLLTEIGKQVTTSLNVEEIVKTVHHYISSSMDLEEVELLHFVEGEKTYYSMDRNGKLRIIPHVEDEKKQNGLNWSLQNKKEVLLNDAEKNYAQYVDEPITSLSGKSPNSLVCIPLLLHDKFEGALAVLSLKKEAYSNYHLDFIRSIASYVAVALDNSNVYGLLNSSKEEIEAEKVKSDNLLLNILPAEVAEELKEKGRADAKKYNNVTVLFSDFEDFTGISEKLSPEQLVDELNVCFKAFDRIMDANGIEKIKTIGDAYMAAGGLHEGKATSSPGVINAAIEMQDFIKNRRQELQKEGKKGFNMRVGVHNGPVVAGIVGDRKFQYDIWGDTVNTASRMETSGKIDKINISESTYLELQNNKDLEFEYRGEVQAKHKGEIKMYFVSKK